MKFIFLFGLLFLFQIDTFSQSEYLKDSSFDFASNSLKISFTPTDLISNIEISAVNFNSNKKGVIFSLKTNEKVEQKNIRIDSLSFKLSDNRKFRLSHPYRDTIFYTKDGSLSLNILYELDKSEIILLKQYSISALILPIEKMTYNFKLKKTSKSKLADFIALNF